MRSILALLLLAGTAAPALAAGDRGDGSRSEARSETRREARQEARSEASAEVRSERSGGNQRSGGNDRSGGNQRSSGNDRSNGGGQPVVHVDSSGGQGSGAPTRSLRASHQGRPDGGERPALQASGQDSTAPGAGAPDTVRNWRMQERASRGPKIVVPSQTSIEDRAAPTLRQSERPLPHVLRNRVPIVSSTPREGTQPPLRAEHRSRDRDHHWNGSWRNDRRYDWNNWRHRHRSLFHLGFYYDPFGWNYRPYSIGWRLWPGYYSSRYWIADPWQYRLPYAPPGYRWIRYWDDALLVDTFSGEVVDVIHNFFW